MLEDILKSKEKSMIENSYRKALSNIGSLFKEPRFLNTNVKRKMIRGVKKSSITRREAITLGFKCSKYLWGACDVDLTEIRGRRSLSEDLVGSIQNHLEGLSSVSSHQTVVTRTRDYNGDKELIPIRNMTCPVSEAYITFPYQKSLSLSSFHKYVEKQFKKPKRLTDLCQYCEHYKALKRFITIKASEAEYFDENFNNPEEFDTKNLLQFFENIRDR